MNEKSLRLIKESIDTWRQSLRYTYENKQLSAVASPIAKGEVILYFGNNVHSFSCNGELIPISLTSNAFHTTTLSIDPISENINGDAYRLKKFLSDFDEKFYQIVENKLAECSEKLSTSDPIFW